MVDLICIDRFINFQFPEGELVKVIKIMVETKVFMQNIITSPMSTPMSKHFPLA